jgi:hypothetical protein
MGMTTKVFSKVASLCMLYIMYLVLICIFFYLPYNCVHEHKIHDFGIFWKVSEYIKNGDLGRIYSKVSNGTLDESYLRYFWYPPTFAILCRPLSALSLSSAFSIFVWILLAAQASFSLAFSSTIARTKRHIAVCKGLLLSFTFLPASLSIAVGQPGILIGLLPMTFAYGALVKSNTILFGAMIGILALKPQFLIPPFLILAVYASCQLLNNAAALKANVLRFILGVFSTFLPAAILASLFFSLNDWILWLDRVHSATDFVYSGFTGYDEPSHLIASLPMAIAFQIKNMPHQFIHLFCFCIILTTTIIECWIVRQILKSNLPTRLKIDLTVISALSCFPIQAPYLRIYDLVLLLLPFSIILLRPSESNTAVLKKIRTATIAIICCADLYVLSIPVALANNIKNGNIFIVTALTAYWIYISSKILKASFKNECLSEL